jgi:flagellar biosynthetic protein FliO
MQGLLEFSLVSTGVKTVTMLFIVLAVLLLVVFMLKKFSFLKREVKGELPIKILSSLPLSAKDRIEIVEIGAEKIVLGVSAAGIQFLTKITEIPGDE